MIPIFLGDKQDGQGPSAIAMIDPSTPHWMNGVLAPCNTSEDGSVPFFVIQHDGATGEGPFDKSIHEAYFDFSINYRGVWETRIYMRENEKWGSDIFTMAELWKELVPKLADLYRAANGSDIPDTDYFA